MGKGRRLLIGLLPTFFLLLTGEIAARVVYAVRNNDSRYLVAPLGGVRVPVVFPLEPKKTYTEWDPCSGRKITFTVNRQGGRGRDWTETKPTGAIRLVAIGGSSTFGVNNPDEATWPAYLENFLRERQGSNPEVFNAGFPGYALKDFSEFTLRRLSAYSPDWILYYEGWNDTDSPVATQVHHQVRRFHEQTWLGGLSNLFYRRSMLYTTLLEKTQFLRASQKSGLLPPIRSFENGLEEFTRRIRQEHAVPVFVLQVLEPYRSSAVMGLQQVLQAADLENPREIEGLLRKALAQDLRTDYDSLTKLRVYQTQVLREVVRRTGQKLGVQVVDPQPVFLEQEGQEPMFCDVVHLTDRGNRLLARIIADQIRLRAGS